MSEADRGIPVVLSPRDLAQAGVLDAALRPNAGVGLLAERRRNGPPGLLGESLTVYRPTLRERFGNAIYDGANAVGLGSIANRMRGEAQMAADFLPGIGDAIGAQEGVQAYENGDYLGAAAGGAGLIPVAGDLAGAGLKAMFLGVGAKTADRAALAKAEEMAAAGADRQAIWDATGWFQGADDKWRFEVDDSTSMLKGTGSPSELSERWGGTVGSAMRHPELFDAYPKMREVRLEGREFNSPAQRGRLERFEDGSRNVVVSDRLRGNDARSTVLHEMQHDVQDREGFALGGNEETALGAVRDDKARRTVALSRQITATMREFPEAAQFYRLKNQAEIAQDWDEVSRLEGALYGAPGGEKLLQLDWDRSEVHYEEAPDPQEAYRRLAGEVEARNVQARMNMTSAERRAAAPWTTEDVARKDQILPRR